jgi:hypothetical protein
LKRLTGGHPAILYNHNRVYQELVFPVVQGTYYNPSELRLTINLSNTSSQSAKITYTVYTEQKTCDITLVFVPTLKLRELSTPTETRYSNLIPVATLNFLTTR